MHVVTQLQSSWDGHPSERWGVYPIIQKTKKQNKLSVKMPYLKHKTVENQKKKMEEQKKTLLSVFTLIGQFFQNRIKLN